MRERTDSICAVVDSIVVVMPDDSFVSYERISTVGAQREILILLAMRTCVHGMRSTHLILPSMFAKDTPVTKVQATASSDPYGRKTTWPRSMDGAGKFENLQ